MSKKELVYEAHGKTMTLKEWAEFLGVKYSTLWARKSKGMSPDEFLVARLPKKPKPRDLKRTIEKVCLNCNAKFVIPRSRDWREHCCSSACKAAHSKAKSDALRLSRTRSCLKCGLSFVAKKSQLDAGGGNYCSVACHYEEVGMVALHQPDVQKKAAANLQRLRDAGLVNYASGEKNPKWRGGREAYLKRVRADMEANPEKYAAMNREYRQKNPERVREWAQKRAGRKVGRLPKGFVAKLKALQKNKCAYCHADVSESFHVDHIQPLAKGGKHHKSNIQILCPTCNVRKSAKCPIKYRQETGFLL